jgi:hypothetical protein
MIIPEHADPLLISLMYDFGFIWCVHQIDKIWQENQNV